MMSDQHDLDTSKDDSVGAFRNWSHCFGLSGSKVVLTLLT